MRHYEFTGEILQYGDRILRQIRCTKALPDVEIGQVGGWIESGKNLKDEAWVSDNAIIYDNAVACNHARMHHYAVACDRALVRDHAKIGGCAVLGGSSTACDHAVIEGSISLYGQVKIGNDAHITKTSDICFFSGFGRSNRETMAFRTANGGVRVKSGCFNGTLSEFEAAVKKTHGDSQHGREYMAIIEVIKTRFYPNYKLLVDKYKEL